MNKDNIYMGSNGEKRRGDSFCVHCVYKHLLHICNLPIFVLNKSKMPKLVVLDIDIIQKLTGP